MKPVDADPGGIEAIRSAITALAALCPMPVASTGSTPLDAELGQAWRTLGSALADLAEALTGLTGVDESPDQAAPIRN